MRLFALVAAVLLAGGCAQVPQQDVVRSTPPSTDASTRALTGCVTQPSRCGYPDATTTGVQDRSKLRHVPRDVTSGPGWAWDPRGWLQVRSDGAIVENLWVSGPIDVMGAHVTVRNNVIDVTGDTWGVALRHAKDATVSGNTIGGVGITPRLMVGIKDIYGDSTGTVITGNDIAGASTGIQLGAGTLRDNYIHDLAMAAGDHVNGITSNGASTPLTIQHNTVLNQFDQTDAIGLFQDDGVEANRLITDNLLAGGGYTIYGGDNRRFGTTSNIVITGNRFSDLYFPKGGSEGPLAYFDAAGQGNEWSGNYWDRDGSAVS